MLEGMPLQLSPEQVSECGEFGRKCLLSISRPVFVPLADPDASKNKTTQRGRKSHGPRKTREILAFPRPLGHFESPRRHGEGRNEGDVGGTEGIGEKERRGEERRDQNGEGYRKGRDGTVPLNVILYLL